MMAKEDIIRYRFFNAQAWAFTINMNRFLLLTSAEKTPSKIYESKK